jgi:prepilin-type N-terminal cleavage/methylation domain-containing protein
VTSDSLNVPRAGRPLSGAFTLLELLTVIVIIAILAVLLIPAVAGVRSRIEKASCIANLRGLYGAANSYTQQYGHWPQISTTLLKSKSREYDKQWIAMLQPYGLSEKNWICPSTQRLMGSPDVTKPELTRSDYLAMPFDDKPMTPYRWSNQPWFVERGAPHGSGNFVILTNGRVVDLKELTEHPPH